MNRTMQGTLGAVALVVAAQASAQVTFYEGEGFRGRAFTTDRQVDDFRRFGFNDRASSVVIERGRWEVCEDSRFRGRCVVLRRGSYDTLARMGVNDRISSLRPVAARGRVMNEGPEPLAAPTYEWRRRPNERVFQAPVTAVRAVVGPPEQRCWVERQQVAEPSRAPSVGGAIAGAVIGGILGHQIGGGRGQDIATAGGAVAGAAIGSGAGRSGSGAQYADVRRCETAASTTPAYWDVSYTFRGVQHRAQMTAQPGPTILVNQNGEPRQ